jgi:hypothetical protein
MKTKILLSYVLVMALATIMISCDNDQDKIPPVPTADDTMATGYVRDTNGSPIANVSVTDGVSIVRTDANGYFSLAVSPTAKYIYYSTPAEYEINLGATSDRPEFYTKTVYYGTKHEYDFTLTKLSSSEDNFTLFCLGDPQTKDTETIDRYNAETAADIKEYSQTISGAKYGVVLGDIVNNTWDIYPQMQEALTATSHGMPLMMVAGNHDHNWATVGTDANDYLNAFGPDYYSFDRGQAHILVLDDCISDGNSSYNGGLGDVQTAWALEDLKYVSKDKLLILCMHIPYYSSYNEANDGGNLTKVVEACSEFANFTIMSAHKHTNNNFFPVVNGKTIYEHNAGATCGAHWYSTVNMDGAPIGYGIYTINGTEVTSWVYKAVRYSTNFQARLYRGSGKWGNYQFAKKGTNRIIVNVWNVDPEWKIVAVEDGVETDITSTLHSDIDAWASGYHVNVQGRSTSTYGDTKKYHYYYYTLKNAATTDFKVVVYDRFGNAYTQTDIIESEDINLAGQYPY